GSRGVASPSASAARPSRGRTGPGSCAMRSSWRRTRKTARPSRPESRASPTTIPWCGRPRSGPSRAARNASAGWHAALPRPSPTRRYARECWLTRRRLEAEAAVALADRPSFRRPRLDVPLIAPPLGKASHLVLRQLYGRRRRLLDDQVAVPLVLPDREHVLAGAR